MNHWPRRFCIVMCTCLNLCTHLIQRYLNIFHCSCPVFLENHETSAVLDVNGVLILRGSKPLGCFINQESFNESAEFLCLEDLKREFSHF